MSTFRRSARTLFGIALALGCLGASMTAGAEVSDDCSSWTLLPDFRCEQRTARPENTFNVMGMPFLFEDPYITTGLNLVWVYHTFPESSPLGGLPPALLAGLAPGAVEYTQTGGHLNLLALQIRLAVTDRLAFIATKDGATFQRPGNLLLPDDDGFYDMTVGFKYALIDDRENDFWGMERIGLANANLVGSLGGQIPVDDQANSTSIFYNVHLDYGIPIDTDVVKFVVPFVEVNGLYYTSGGRGRNNVNTTLGQLPVSAIESLYGSFEGVDVANLGATGVEGNSLVVMGGGIRVPTKWGVSFGAMFEGVVTSRTDIYDKRFTAMVTWEL